MLGFAAGGVGVAQIEQMRPKGSRDPPCEPSMVTVIRQGDGRYHASCVEQVAETPLPPTTGELGINLRLDPLAVPGRVLAAAYEGRTRRGAP
jgi:putative transposase